MIGSWPKRLGLAFVLGLAATAWPAQAGADATVVFSNPKPGSDLTTVPSSVTLDFSEALETTLSHADVTTPGGQRFESRAVGDQEFVVTLSGTERGVYRVEWVAVSAVDGHAIHGAFDFGVGAAPNGAGPLERSAPSPADVAVAVLRWLEYLGLIGVIGIFVVRRLAANPPRLGWARPPMHLALAAALVGGIGVVGAEAFGAAGSLPGALDYLVGGPPGWVRVGRVAAEGVALAFCLRGQPLVAPLALLATALLALAGHAAGVRPAAGAIFTDALHLMSAGVWAGGIMALATLRPPGGWKGDEGQALLGRFGRVALLAFAITALTGVLRATAELTGVGDLWATPYGIVLTAKSAGVLAMVVLSALVWRRGMALARVEATVGLIVLAATALLAAYPLPPARVADAGAIRETSGLQQVRPLTQVLLRAAPPESVERGIESRRADGA